MNNNLDRIQLIDRESLRENDYFQSLLEQAFSKELISSVEIERIRYECLELLAYTTERYNFGDSSSIQVEKAQELMKSIFYTVSLSLKEYQYPDDAVVALQQKKVKELYQIGRKIIDKMMFTTKTIHKKLISELIDTPNLYYSSTIKEGINGFFKLYDPDYFAHETHITADYPLSRQTSQLDGIEFIRTYVVSAFYENQFMRFFSADSIHHLLCGYEKNYEELVINLYEPILTACIGCVIAETDIRSLDITTSGMKRIESIFRSKTKKECAVILSNAVTKLCDRLQCSDKLKLYMKYGVAVPARKIELAANNNTLDQVFALPKYPENAPKIVFSCGEKMDNELYRKMIDEIILCENVQDKLSIIQENIHSLADLMDVLLDAEMLPSEIQSILLNLSLPELAVLTKKYFIHSDIDLDTANFRESEILLRKCLKEYIAKLSYEQQLMLKRTEDALREEIV